MRSCDVMQQCQELKDRIIIDDNINWEVRHQLQQILERILLTDLDYGLSKQSEQMLWNSCFKSCIDFYQTKLRQKKTEEDVAFLSMFLTSSIGFFAQFLSKLCRFYQFNLTNCHKSDAYLGILNGHWDKPRRTSKSNTRYIAQFCLIHLGDIARYQKRLNEAESFYLNACRVSPTNGHPFNQLAILETSRSKNLSAIYLYTRSLYVENPFTLASTNLDKFCSMVDLKLQTQSYIEKFFKFIAVIHLMIPDDLTATENELIKQICSDLKSAILTESLSSHDVMHIFIITIGCVWKINSSKDSNSLNEESVNLESNAIGFSTDEKRCLKLLIEFLQSFFVAILQVASVDGENLFNVIKLTSDWFKNYYHLLKFNGFCGEKSQLFLVLCKFLNYVQTLEINIDENETLNEYILPEDQEMIGFLPLDATFQGSTNDDNSVVSPNANITAILRRRKFLNFGHFIVNFVKDNDLISVKTVQLNDHKQSLEFSTKVVIEDAPIQKKSITEEKCVKFKTEISEEKMASSPEQGKTSKRQTKVLPLLTIFEKEKVKEGNDKDTPKNDQPKFKIAPPGSKVDLPLAPERKDDDETSVGSDSATANQPDKARYELPPRFQAAKLKHALSGAPSFGNFERRLPEASRGNYSDGRPPNLNLTSFPALLPQPPWGIMPTEFHKTPGVRPRGPPPFPIPPSASMSLPFTAAPPPGFSMHSHQPPPPPSRPHVPDLSRPPPPFAIGTSTDSGSSRPPAPPNSMWSQPPMFMNSENVYFKMWQPKSSHVANVSGSSAPPNPDEIWNSNFDWTQKESTFNPHLASSNADDEDSGRQLPYFTNSAQNPGPLQKPTPGFGLQQSTNSSDIATVSSGSGSRSLVDNENETQDIVDGQFTLFGVGSGNLLEYSKWK